VTEEDFFDEIRASKTRGDESQFLKQIITLGLRHYYKLDWSRHQLEIYPDKTITLQDRQTFIDDLTAEQHINHLKMSEATLERYADNHPRNGTFNEGVIQGVVGNIVWSIILITLYLSLRFFGLDVLTAIAPEKSSMSVPVATQCTTSAPLPK
jgi:hypothetical protein